MSLQRWLWSRYLRRYWAALALAMGFMALEGSMLGVLSWVMKPMFDRVFVAGEAGAVWKVGLIILAIFLARAISSVGQKVTLVRIQQRCAGDIRSDLLRHLMALDGSFHQRHPPGELIERVQGDVQAINTVWSTFAVAFGRDLVALIWLFGVALWVDPIWTLIALVGIPILVLPSLAVQGYVRRQSTAARVVAAKGSTRLDEVFHGIDAVKLNGLESYQSDRYDRLLDERVRTEVRAASGQALIPGLIDVMTGIGFLGVLVYGGGEIIAGTKTVGEFMAFFTAMALAFEPLRRLGGLSGLWQTAVASLSRVRILFDTRSVLTRPANPAPAPTAAPEIRFDDVHLSYGETSVLRGVSFVAEPGQTTALVGASGAGKSTLFRLLSRLAEPNSGTITVNDVALAEYAPETLRGLLSTVSQDAALFDDSLRENILLGRDDVGLRAATQAAHVADFTDGLPDGLDTPAGPRGSALSGGQRQRIAIARALVRDTPVLLLDEATSALDTKSEAIVQRALDGLAQGRTTLVIAHRLSTVQNADKIVVMDQGRVIEQGTHAELLEKRGTYASLYTLQFKDPS